MIDWATLLEQAGNGLAPLNGALDVLRKARDLVHLGDKGKSPAVNAELALLIDDLQSRLIASINTVSVLQSANKDLIEENMKLKNFLVEKDNYEMRSVGDYAFVYLKKDAVTGDKTTPHYCAPCFDQREKSVLQFRERVGARDRLVCPRCKAEVLVANGLPTFSHSTRGQTTEGWGGIGD